MEFSAAQIAELLGGKVEGDPQVTVDTVAKIEEATPRSLTFLANPKYTEYIYSTGASIVLVNADFQPEKNLPEGCSLIRVDDAYQGLARLLEYYDQYKQKKTGTEDTAWIAEDAEVDREGYIGHFAVISAGAVVGKRARVHDHCYIGANVSIGEGTLLYPGVRVLDGCRIGKNCILHPGVTIGSEGFGFAPNDENNYQKVAQTGNVVIEDQVEIGANSTIDRATLGSTVIRKGVKLDNLIQVAHNVEIGENTVIAAQSGIAGSSKIGKNCMIGGQVGIIGHLKIADEVKIAAQSGIGKDIENKGEVVQGSPAFEYKEYNRAYATFRNLSRMRKQLDKMEQELKQLKEVTKG